MKERYKLIFLSLIMSVLILLVIKQSVYFYRGIKNLPLPNTYSRQHNEMSVDRWMTVSETAERYGLTEKEVFDYLQIIPEPGDENLTLRELKIKYQKTSEEMQKNLQQIINNARKTGQAP